MLPDYAAIKLCALHLIRLLARAARSELFLGFYDGVAGLVRLPYQDMQQDGPVELATGIGKGVGGLVLKPISSTIGVGAYSKRWIRRARMNQGAKDIRDYMNKSRTDAPNSPQGNEVEEARSRALSQWTSREQRQLEEAREKQQKANVPKPKKHYWRHRQGGQCS